MTEVTITRPDWKQHCKVCPVVDDTAWYVCYDNGPVRLRLTIRGTWHADEMDIYFPTKGAAYHALETAPKPLADPYQRIAQLESVCRMAAGVLNTQYENMTLQQVQNLPWLSAAICHLAQDLDAASNGANP